MTSHTVKLTPEQGETLEQHLRANNWFFREVPYTRYAAEKEKVNVALYTSGKLVVQGKDTRDFVEFVLEPVVLQKASLGYEETLQPEILLPRIGVDESGKGDFFGPMCIAGVYVNREVIAKWKEAGIRDSKAIGSDRKIADLAKLIRETPGCVQSVVAIGNEAYNRLHAKMGSVNSVLAWGHARVIENLMGLSYQMQPPPVKAISDQFAASKSVVQRALMGMGRTLELVQRHRAEEDVAVAAASILARNEFVDRLARLGRDLGIVLPKGASPAVEKAARELVDRHGKEALSKVAKMHFRTSYRVLGLPEPPKQEWRPQKKASG